MGPGLSNGLLLTGIKDPGTPPGDIPAYLANYDDPTGPLNRGAETDIWNIDYQTGEVKATWVNPGGDVVDLTMITNGVTIAATGDFTAFNNLNGGNWFYLAFTFPVSSSG
ncbi:hypothetical protein HYPSUDRAFT_319971 [Hypholoma sublateritium FD-334 SS-4]|uniref:Uncharacterized protein n=1 Tax=Hypholoma sublateritium (strain FD-334 SS-4) TaxID=945553 RepID=A0A0D2P654_HYPSF|nr:hypothetical protein HYPSUDRAFT_319971 [Hypholoma sublateritium FD-334 SS-4]